MFESRLRQEVDQRFNGEDLRLICAELGLDYDDDLIGRTKDARILSLVQYILKNELMEPLLVALQEQRPSVEWRSLLANDGSQSQIVYWSDQLRILIRNNRAVQAGLGILALVILAGVIFLLVQEPESPPDATSTSVISIGETGSTATLTLSPPPGTPETAAPVPTITPTPTSDSEIVPDVFIIEFEGAAEQDIRLARRIEDDLRDKLAEFGLDEIHIRTQTEPIKSIEEAASLASESGTKVVVWGWLDSVGVNVRIFLNDDKQARRIARTDELPLAGLENTTDELAFLVTDTIPNNVSFISLFVIGQLYYQNNQYQDGFNAFDAAAANLPENVIFTNKALLYFFEARQLDYGGSDDLDTIACGYAQAIETDPEFMPAYLNLSILLYHNRDYQPPECVEDDDYRSLISRAAELQPESAVVRYNKLAMRNSITPELTEGNLAEIQEIIDADPSIPGTYLMLFRLLALREEWEGAIEALETAAALLPDFVDIHFNLGQLHILTGDLEQAESELQLALELAPDDGETLLALANVALLAGSSAEATDYLEQIRPPESEWIYDDPGYVATLLHSQIAYQTGNIQEAVDTIVALADEEGLGDEGQYYEYDIFIAYLLGYLYRQNGRPDAAAAIFEKGVELGYPYYEDMEIRTQNYTTFLAWRRLDISCELYELTELEEMDFQDLNSCGEGTLVSGATMGLEEYIAYIYDTLQTAVAYRFKNIPNVLSGQACPFVYTYDDALNRWQFDNTIIFKLIGPESEKPQKRQLSNFDGRLLIREVEPEVSYLDQVYVIVIDSQGRQTILTHNFAPLQEADNHYHIMNTGDNLMLTFPDYNLLEDVSQVWAVAEGYYVPLVTSN